MIGTNICIIDDGFMLPAVDANLQTHSYFCGAAIRALASHDWGRDEPLKDLCTSLIEQLDDNGAPIWNVAGFRLPVFYEDAFNAGKYRSDLIVFDWEYRGDEVDQVASIKAIMDQTHAFVAIFTGVDQIENVRKVVETELEAFSDRIQLLEKETDLGSQHGTLLKLLEAQQTSNFAFKFGASLRASVNFSLDTVLHKLSALNLDKVVKILASQDNDPIDADLKEMIGEKLKEKVKADPSFGNLIKKIEISEEASTELLEIVAEVIKTDVSSLELEHSVENEVALEEADQEIMSQLWSYRLYHNPADNVVRGGDVILPEGGDGGELYLVLTPPCDLAQFWSKTDGKLAVVRLELLPEQNDQLRERAKLFKSLGKVRDGLKSGVSSLTNGERLNVLPGKSFLIPLVPVSISNTVELLNYRVNSHSLMSIDVPLPTELTIEGVSSDQRSKAALRYDHLPYSRVTKISDPFCGAILSATLANLAGWGVADYPRALTSKFGKQFSESLKEPQNG